MCYGNLKKCTRYFFRVWSGGHQTPSTEYLHLIILAEETLTDEECQHLCRLCDFAYFFRIEIYIQFAFLCWSPPWVRRSDHVFRHRGSVRWRNSSHLYFVYAKAYFHLIHFMQFILSTRRNQPTCWVDAPSCFVNEQYCQQAIRSCLSLRLTHTST